MRNQYDVVQKYSKSAGLEYYLCAADLQGVIRLLDKRGTRKKQLREIVYLVVSS